LYQGLFSRFIEISNAIEQKISEEFDQVNFPNGMVCSLIFFFSFLKFLILEIFNFWTTKKFLILDNFEEVLLSVFNPAEKVVWNSLTKMQGSIQIQPIVWFPRFFILFYFLFFKKKKY